MQREGVLEACTIRVGLSLLAESEQQRVGLVVRVKVGVVARGLEAADERRRLYRATRVKRVQRLGCSGSLRKRQLGGISSVPIVESFVRWETVKRSIMKRS